MNVFIAYSYKLFYKSVIGMRMFIKVKIKLKTILSIILLMSLIFSGYCYQYILTGEKNCLSWIDENKALITYDNITTLSPIKYEMLSSDYKKLFSKKEFDSVNNGTDSYNISIKLYEVTTI